MRSYILNLAPLETRLDIAMLGLIHRSVLGCGPRHFANIFLPSPPSVSQKHDKQLLSHRSPRHLQILSRSALGLVDVHNLLPAQVVCQKSVASMQHELQALFNLECGTVTVASFTPSLHVSLCMSTRCNCSHDFLFLWKLLKTCRTLRFCVSTRVTHDV